VVRLFLGGDSIEAIGGGVSKKNKLTATPFNLYNFFRKTKYRGNKQDAENTGNYH